MLKALGAFDSEKWDRFDKFQYFNLLLTLNKRSELKSNAYSRLLGVTYLYDANWKAVGAMVTEKWVRFDRNRPFDLILTLNKRSDVKSEGFSGCLGVTSIYDAHLEALGAMVTEKWGRFDKFRPFDLILTLNERSEVKSDGFSGFLGATLLYDTNLEALGAIGKE